MSNSDRRLRVVVFGATGNVGTALVRSLSRDPRIDKIVGVARRRPRHAVVGPLANVEWRALDITRDPFDVIEGADVVVHLAWKIQPSHREAEMRSTNIDGSRRLIDACVRHGTAALVYASSVGAYAPGLKVRVDEHHPTTGIATSTYSRHKAEVERMLDEVEHEQPWMRIVRMRTSLVFQRRAASQIHRLFLGPLLPWHLPHLIRFVPRFDELILQVTHADDVADAYRLAITGDVSGPFNIAAEPVLTPQLIADVVGGKAVELPVGVVRGAMSVSHRLHLQPCEPGWLDMAVETPLMDTSTARRELGWTPTMSSIEVLCELLDGIGEGAGDVTEPLRSRHSARAGRRRRSSASTARR